MQLSTLAILLGLIFAAAHLYGVINPQRFGTLLRKLPRSTFIGYILVAVALGWFLYYLKHEAISDFAQYRGRMYLFFTAIGVGTCIFVKDFLGARGFALVLLLLGKLMVDTARWSDTSWRLVIQCWAYLWVVAGIWITISPWRLRDLIDWTTATPQRTRVSSAVRVAFGVFVAVLGVTIFRSPS